MRACASARPYGLQQAARSQLASACHPVLQHAHFDTFAATTALHPHSGAADAAMAEHVPVAPRLSPPRLTLGPNPPVTSNEQTDPSGLTKDGVRVRDIRDIDFSVPGMYSRVLYNGRPLHSLFPAHARGVAFVWDVRGKVLWLCVHAWYDEEHITVLGVEKFEGDTIKTAIYRCIIDYATFRAVCAFAEDTSCPPPTVAANKYVLLCKQD